MVEFASSTRSMGSIERSLARAPAHIRAAVNKARRQSGLAPLRFPTAASRLAEVREQAGEALARLRHAMSGMR